MKTNLSLFFLILCSFNGFGQFDSFLSQLKTSGKDFAIATLVLAHRSRSNAAELEVLDSAMIMIPTQVGESKLDVENYRFRTVTGHSFEMNGKSYIQVWLYYDSHTSDPTDDIFILALPFEVPRELLDEELSHYHDRALVPYKFEDAPNGRSRVPAQEVEVIRTN